MKKYLMLLALFIAVNACAKDIVVPPIPPIDCTAVTKTLKFKWDYDNDIVDGFRLYQSVDTGHTLMQTCLGQLTRTCSFEMPLSPCTCYYFTATAFRNIAESSHSNTVPVQCGEQAVNNSNIEVEIE